MGDRESRLDQAIDLMQLGHAEEAIPYILASIELECSGFDGRLTLEQARYMLESDDASLGRIDAPDYPTGGFPGSSNERTARRLRKKARRIPTGISGAEVTEQLENAKWYITRGRFPEAATVYGDCLAMFPDDLRLLFLRGCVHVANRDLDKASDDFTKAVSGNVVSR